VTFADETGTGILWNDLLLDGGSLLEARATDGWWQVTVRYRDRDLLTEAYERLVGRDQRRSPARDRRDRRRRL